MTATPPAPRISSIACSAVGQRRGTKAFAPGHQVLLEEGAEVAAGAGRPGDVGAADRERVAGLADRVLEVQVEALAAQLLDDLAGAGDALVLGALAGAGDLAEVDPVAADVEVFGVLVHAGHLDRRHQLDAEPLGGARRLGDAGDRVVVGQGEGRDARLGRPLDDLRRRQLAVGDGRVALQLDQHRAAA